MSVNNQHPEFPTFNKLWKKCRDIYKGEDHIKKLEDEYLRPTAGQVVDGMGIGQDGRLAYENYLARAVLPENFEEGVNTFCGLLHGNEATIGLPPELEFLRYKATRQGESLLALLRRINAEQLITGRIGLLVDAYKEPQVNGDLFIATYTAENIPNWDGMYELDFVVLDESGNYRDGYFWQYENRYRVLELVDGVYTQTVWRNGAAEEQFVPVFKGKKPISLPFVFINANDTNPNPQKPPLLGLANAVLSIYQSEADYRQNLYMQGQDTLVLIGQVKNTSLNPIEDDSIRVGAGSRINLDLQGDAKYVGVSGEGLGEQRLALEADRKKAEYKGGQFIDTRAAKNESGAALKTRLAAQTSTLNQVALTSANALEKLLKDICVVIGADPELVEIEPNLEFAENVNIGDDVVKLITARNMGAPISEQTLHELISAKGLTKYDYEVELQMMADKPINPAFKATVNSQIDNKQTKL